MSVFILEESKKVIFNNFTYWQGYYSVERILTFCILENYFLINYRNVNNFEQIFIKHL